MPYLWICPIWRIQGQLPECVLLVRGSSYGWGGGRWFGRCRPGGRASHFPVELRRVPVWQFLLAMYDLLTFICLAFISNQLCFYNEGFYWEDSLTFAGNPFRSAKNPVRRAKFCRNARTGVSSPRCLSGPRSPPLRHIAPVWPERGIQTHEQIRWWGSGRWWNLSYRVSFWRSRGGTYPATFTYTGQRKLTISMNRHVDKAPSSLLSTFL